MNSCVKPREKGMRMAIENFVSIFPHYMIDAATQRGFKFIHIRWNCSRLRASALMHRWNLCTPSKVLCGETMTIGYYFLFIFYSLAVIHIYFRCCSVSLCGMRSSSSAQRTWHCIATAITIRMIAVNNDLNATSTSWHSHSRTRHALPNNRIGRQPATLCARAPHNKLKIDYYYY